MPLLRDLFGLFRSEPDHPTARKPKPKPETRKPVRRQKTIVIDYKNRRFGILKE